MISADSRKSIWSKKACLDEINSNVPSLDKHAGIEFIEAGPDYLRARMDMNENTHQPFGRLHGGASCVLIETMGSIGASLTISDNKAAVGTDLSASHLRGVRSGHVIGEARPLKLGRHMQFWEVNISTEDGKQICAGKLTVAIIDGRQM